MSSLREGSAVQSLIESEQNSRVSPLKENAHAHLLRICLVNLHGRKVRMRIDREDNLAMNVVLAHDFCHLRDLDPGDVKLGDRPVTC